MTPTTVDEEDDDLIPPPMSLSLPELFSPDHQIVEIIREAVSSTELLHERAMERFYRAIEAEQQSNEQKRTKNSDKKPIGDNDDGRSNDESYPLFKSKNRPARRRLSNSGGNWQSKRDRRRSSEGEANVTLHKLSIKLPLPNDVSSSPLLPNVLSDPNLSVDNEKNLISSQKTYDNWSIQAGGSSERLRRWHDTGIDLSNEKSIATMDKENAQNSWKEESSSKVNTDMFSRLKNIE